MSADKNPNYDGRVVRLSPREMAERRADLAAPIFTSVDASGQTVVGGAGLRVFAMEPVKPAQVTLPVSSTAAEQEIRALGEATVQALRLDYQRQRSVVETELEDAVQGLACCRYRVKEDAKELVRVEIELREFVDGLPRRYRRRLGSRPSRLVKFVPWALWAADTTFMSRAYGLYGAPPLPFPSSVYVANASQVLRAGAIAFGLVFGLRLVGGKLREAAEEVRDRWPLGALLGDALVAGAVLVSAVKLVGATATLQKVALAVVTGSGNTAVPDSVLVAVMAFMASVSLATGYFLAEPDLDRFLSLEQRVASAKTRLRDAVAAKCSALGNVRALRRQLVSLDREEAHDVAEAIAHTEAAVDALRTGNVEVYGLEIPQATPGTTTP